jgi:hypothetical protein
MQPPNLKVGLDLKSYPTVLVTNKLKHHQPIEKFQNVNASHAPEKIMGRRERESTVDLRCKINGTPARAVVLPPFANRHGYGYEYQIQYISDTQIRYFHKNTNTGIRI